MIFNSITYFLLLLIVVVLYWNLPYRARIWMILIASLTFYGFWRVEFLAVMLFSTFLDYFCALGIEASKSQRAKRLCLGMSLSGNLGTLFLFKYLGFFTTNVNSVLNLFGAEFQIPLLSLILPLGISFYTFQTMSYTIDVYRGFIKAERDVVLYCSYVTYFPQLVAGPILTASEVIPWLSQRPPFRLSDVAIGLRRILYGLFLKVMLADNISPVVDAGFAMDPQTLSALDVWTLAFMFGYQIYFDFAGYSHIALGSARLMGIVFPENFNFPYLATSPRDFWRRWHISLSSWIRDYLYLPLAGERVHDHSSGGLAAAASDRNDRRRDLALFMSWAIMGLWHGAAWTYVVWGLYHATSVFLYRILQPSTKNLPLLVRLGGGWIVTLLVAMLGWIPFRAQGLSSMATMMSKVVLPAEYLHIGPRENTYLVAFGILVVMIGCFWAQRVGTPLLERRPALAALIETPLFAVVAFFVFTFLRPISQFIYFQF